MRIGLDLDGVCFDYVDNTRQIAKMLWPEQAGRFDKQSTTWNYFSEDWGLTGEQFRELNQFGMEKGYLFTGPIEPGWPEVLEALVADGHTIHIVTHRSIPGVISCTDEWLREHKVPYSSITFVSDVGDKSYTDLDVLIDDKVENVLAWEASGRAAIIYDQPWNQHYDGRGARRACGPHEVRAAIDDLALYGQEEATEATDEVRVVNATTGGEKGSKMARFDLIPIEPMYQVATHYGVGARKYADRNWERGYDWSLSYAALQRHANAFWGGEDIDTETGSHHMAAVVFHALALIEFGITHPDLDDRARVTS